MFFTENINFLLFSSIILCIYWILVLLSSLIKDSSLRFYFLLFGSFLFSFFFCLRDPSIGSDSVNYASLVTNPGQLKQNIEPFFKFLAYMVRVLGGNEYIFFFLISFIINTSLIKAFYNLNKINFSFYYLLFITSFLFINMNMNILRQGVAIGLSSLAISYFFNKNYYKFLFLSLLSILSHLSGVIIFILPIFYSINLSPKKIALFFLLLTFLYFIKLSTFIEPFVNYGFFFKQIYWYLTWEKVKPFQIKHIYYLLLVLFSIVTWLYFKNFKNKTYKIGFYSLFSIFFITAFFREDEFLVDRSSLYFFPFVVMIIFESLSFVKNFGNKLIVSYSLIFGSLLWILQSLYQFYSWWVLGNIR